MTRSELEQKAIQWIINNEGSSLDFDGVYGPQCVDEAQYYNRDVIGGTFLYGASAKDIVNTYPQDFYDWIDNTPDNYPLLGDVVIWGTIVGPDGHIAVCKDANPNSFVSLDQNWNYIGKCVLVTHSYNGVLGWLHPKTQESVQPAPEVVVTPTSTTSTEIPVTASTNGTSPVINVAVDTPQVPEVTQSFNMAVEKANQATEFNIFGWLKSLLTYIKKYFES